MDLRSLLLTAVDVGATDVHCKPGSPPRLRVGGVLRPTTDAPLDAPAVAEAARAVLTPERFAELERSGSVIATHALQGVGRFRVAGYRQRGSFGLVLHLVGHEAPTIAGLGLPDSMATVAAAPKGLVLVGSRPGDGASSTIAALVGARLGASAEHIVSVEDPIEVLHRDDVGIISQLEVGVDTPSLAAGLRATMRLDADVVVASTVPDADTAQAALDVAASGRLVIAAVRGSSARDVIARFCSTAADADTARTALARVLTAVTAQQLIAGPQGRVAAVEICIVTSKVRAAIGRPAGIDDDLDALIHDGVYSGMQSMQLALTELVRARRISVDDALELAPDPDELRITLAR